MGAVVIDGGHLLLIQRGRGPAIGQWSVPGGRVEWGETLAEAVVREVKEETGLDVDCGSFIGLVERRSPDYHYVIHDFRAEVVRPVDEPPAMADRRRPLRAGDDAADAAWVPLDELATTPLVEGMLAFLVEHRIVETGPPDPTGGNR